MKSKRQKHTGAFKAKVAIEALQERETLSELSKKYGIHPNMITRWKKEFLERTPQLFEKTHPADGLELYQGLKEYFDYYNNQLCHQGIDHQIPANRYSKAA